MVSENKSRVHILEIMNSDEDALEAKGLHLRFRAFLKSSYILYN